MKIGIFTLQGPLEGQTLVILDKYSFVDGVMKVNENDALLMRNILCNHYGCDLSFEAIGEKEDASDAGEGSLAVTNTKIGMTEGDKVNAQALSSALANAQRVQDSEKA